MCCRSNTDNRTGLGLSPLRLSASVTQSAQNSQNELQIGNLTLGEGGYTLMSKGAEGRTAAVVQKLPTPAWLGRGLSSW